MAPTRAQLLEVANKVIESFRAWTVEDILATRSADCLSRVLPSTLNKPAQNNDELAASLTKSIPLCLTPFEVSYDETKTVVDEVKREVVLYLSAQTTTIVGPYRNEYVITITVNEEGTLVERLEEFLDSVAYTEFFKKLEASREKGTGT